MFSAALGLAGSALGAIASMNAAKNQAKAAMYDSQQRRLSEREAMDISRQMMGVGADQLLREQQLQQYVYSQNQNNANLALNQRDYGRALTDQDRAQMSRERADELSRLQQIDYAASQEYERRRAQIASNTQITASERQRALDELARAQQIAAQERQYDLQRLQEDQARLEAQRGFSLNEYDYAKSNAADERQFDIGQLTRGQNIASSERQTALDYLNDSRARAQQERDFDVAQLTQAQNQRQQERSFQEGEYRNYRAQAMAERADDLARRNQIDAATNQLSQTLEGALSQMGAFKAAPLLGQDAIAAEAASREATAVDDINRLTDRVASTNEANLIRNGVDQSTRATGERSAIAARMAGEMQKAREGARSEAVRYIAGVNDQLKMSDELERLRREQTLREITSAYGAGIDMMQRAPQVRSALAGPDFSSVGSAVYDRGVQSANNYRGPLDVGTANYNAQVGSSNNYRAPVDIISDILGRNVSSANTYQTPINIGSAVYDQGLNDLGIGMSSQLGPKTAVGIGPYGTSGEYQFTLPQISSASSFFGAGNNMLSSVLNSRSQTANQSQQLAGQAAAGAGGAMGSFLNQLGAFGDTIFKGSGKPDRSGYTGYDGYSMWGGA